MYLGQFLSNLSKLGVKIGTHGIFLGKVTKFKEKMFCLFEVMLQKPQRGWRTSPDPNRVKSRQEKSHKIRHLLFTLIRWLLLIDLIGNK